MDSHLLTQDVLFGSFSHIKQFTSFGQMSIGCPTNSHGSGQWNNGSERWNFMWQGIEDKRAWCVWGLDKTHYNALWWVLSWGYINTAVGAESLSALITVPDILKALKYVYLYTHTHRYVCIYLGGKCTQILKSIYFIYIQQIPPYFQTLNLNT